MPGAGRLLRVEGVRTCPRVHKGGKGPRWRVLKGAV